MTDIWKEPLVSHFGDLVKELRKKKGLTLAEVAKKIGSHKGYVSGIENHKVNPPSVKIIKKYAKVVGYDLRTLVRLAWVDKAPEMLRADAERFLVWCQEQAPGTEASPAPPPPTPDPSGGTPPSAQLVPRPPSQ